MLTAVLDPFDRLAQPQARSGGDDFFRYKTNLAPKPPPTSGAATRT
jgi:hypothetical protein